MLGCQDFRLTLLAIGETIANIVMRDKEYRDESASLL